MENYDDEEDTDHYLLFRGVSILKEQIRQARREQFVLATCILLAIAVARWAH